MEEQGQDERKVGCYRQEFSINVLELISGIFHFDSVHCLHSDVSKPKRKRFLLVSLPFFFFLLLK